MAKKTRQHSIKAPIRLREKELADGTFSLYLDLYTNGKRQYEFLKLYLIPERTRADKVHNAEVREMANQMLAQRLSEFYSGQGLKTRTSKQAKQILLTDYIEVVKEQKRKERRAEGSLANFDTLNRLVKHFKDISIQQIDKEYIRSFANYLLNDYQAKGNKQLKATTIRKNLTLLSCVINEAVQSDLIALNPFTKIKVSGLFKVEQPHRGYLTAEEVKALIVTPCKNERVKNAFLFACFTGLRISDIRKLNQANFAEVNGTTYINLMITKTKAQLSIPVGENAKVFLPKPVTSSNALFDLPAQPATNKHIRKWCAEAGITKDVTFHIARHTYATLMISGGENVYNVMELLGHSNVKTTQIYADIVNENKVNAVAKLDNLFK